MPEKIPELWFGRGGILLCVRPCLGQSFAGVSSVHTPGCCLGCCVAPAPGRGAKCIAYLGILTRVPLIVAVVPQLYEQYLGVRAALDNCYLCRELGARLECCACERTVHPLCLRSPATCEEELPGGGWVCPCCGEDQKVRTICFKGQKLHESSCAWVGGMHRQEMCRRRDAFLPT